MDIPYLSKHIRARQAVIEETARRQKEWEEQSVRRARAFQNLHFLVCIREKDGRKNIVETEFIRALTKEGGNVGFLADHIAKEISAGNMANVPKESTVVIGTSWIEQKVTFERHQTKDFLGDKVFVPGSTIERAHLDFRVLSFSGMETKIVTAAYVSEYISLLGGKAVRHLIEHSERMAKK